MLLKHFCQYLLQFLTTSLPKAAETQAYNQHKCSLSISIEDKFLSENAK